VKESHNLAHVANLKEKTKKERKTFQLFGSFWYFCDAFSHH